MNKEFLPEYYKYHRDTILLVSESIEKSGYGLCDGYGIRCDNIFGIWRRQNTAYVKDEANWNCLCEECQIEVDEHWDGMWADYYSSRL